MEGKGESERKGREGNGGRGRWREEDCEGV